MDYCTVWSATVCPPVPSLWGNTTVYTHSEHGGRPRCFHKVTYRNSYTPHVQSYIVLVLVVGRGSCPILASVRTLGFVCDRNIEPQIGS
jgi:hypothetical protein